MTEETGKELSLTISEIEAFADMFKFILENPIAGNEVEMAIKKKINEAKAIAIDEFIDMLKKKEVRDLVRRKRYNG